MFIKSNAYVLRAFATDTLLLVLQCTRCMYVLIISFVLCVYVCVCPQRKVGGQTAVVERGLNPGPRRRKEGTRNIKEIMTTVSVYNLCGGANRVLCYNMMSIVH